MPASLAFDFHDAVITHVPHASPQLLSMYVELYPIMYPDKPRVELAFGHLFNPIKVIKLVNALQDEAEEDWIGCRIDAFHYDTKKAATENNLWFFLAVDGFDGIRIHCREFQITQLKGR